MDKVMKWAPLAVALLAMVVSSCTALGIRPLPNPYEEAQTQAEYIYVTVGSYNAAQKATITTCGAAEPDTVIGNTCVQLITIEQTIRPAVTAAGQIGAEYADINMRIKSVGTDAPLEWVQLATEIAGRLAVVYEPVRNDVELFLDMAGNLTQTE